MLLSVDASHATARLSALIIDRQMLPFAPDARHVYELYRGVNQSWNYDDVPALIPLPHRLT